MELFKIFGSIFVDNKSAIDSLNKTDKEAYKVNNAMNKLSETGAKIGKAVAVGAVAIGASMVAITKKTMDTMENIDKASQRAGMGAEEFQRWSHVAGLSGIEMTKLEQAAIKNQRALAQASQGAGKASEAYKRMGIDVKGLTSDQVFEQVILSLSDMEDETQRNSIANDIFGKSFADLAPLLNSGSDEIKSMKSELDALGGVMSADSVKAGAALNDTIDRVTKLFGALALNIGNELIPYFDKFGNWILNNKDSIQSNFSTVFNIIKDSIGFVIDKSEILVPILSGLLGGFIAFKIISFIAGLYTFFAGVLSSVSVAGGILNLVLAANPFVLVAVAIAALIAVGVLLVQNWDWVRETAINVFGAVRDFIKEVVDGVISFLRSVVDFFLNNWQGILLFMLNPFAGAFKLLYDNFEGFRNFVDGIMSSIKDYFSSMGINIGNIANTILEKITGTFDSVKNAILNPVDSAVNGVKKMVDKMLGFFNFKWEFPKLKMPHFKVSGSMNPLKWISDGVPKLSVDWFAKGGIMTKPTAFGMNGDRIMAGGEKSKEAILPLDEKNLSGIGRGIARTMNNNVSDYGHLIRMLKDLLSGMKFELVDGGNSIRAIIDSRLIEVM